MREAVVQRETRHCAMQIERPSSQVVVVRIDGIDVGELGRWPFEVLAENVGERDGIELFIDARKARGVSIDVSGAWARWLLRHAPRLRTVTLVSSSPFVQVTARFVRRFAGLGARMRITDDEGLFDSALVLACS